MGNKESKKKQPDLNEMLINMRMKSKMFHRESKKAAKEKDANYKKAKDCLKKGNEEGARLFLGSAAQKDSESQKYMKIATRLEALSAKIGAGTNQVGLMEHLNNLTPFLEQQANDMPIDQVYNNMQRFEQAFDSMSIQGKMIDEAVDNNMTDKGTMSNVSSLFKIFRLIK